jgi:hypothetical protein
VPERLQFFGSTVDRFQNSIATKQVQGPNLGPGTYTISNNGNGAKTKMRNAADIPFASTNMRFNNGQQKQGVEVPGPGTYQDKSIVD